MEGHNFDKLQKTAFSLLRVFLPQQAERTTMNRNSGVIGPEDYLEPRCPLKCENDSNTYLQSIPQTRVLAKLDEYLAKRDYSAAERHLLYWQEEARQGHDLQGQLLVCNELIGHYRKNGQREQAFSACNEAIRLLDALHFTDHFSAGTTYVNLATAYSAFGEDDRALPFFVRAREIYESNHADAELLGGLYNNMGLCCTSLGRYSEAQALFALAMDRMKTVPGGELEQAITCLNLADCLDAEQGRDARENRIKSLLKRARHLLLDTQVAKDGYYAFVCEKCAAGFQAYGDGETAELLSELAEKIYERA